jgi:DnaK suppressor protein
MKKKTNITLPENYKPTPHEEFMNPMQVAYFRGKILKWRQEILMGSHETISNLQEESTNTEADLNDRASIETDRSLELRARDRERKLLGKIESALKRLDNGEFGYCEETGEPISLARLEARPIATMSIEAQERHERKEKIYREE